MNDGVRVDLLGFMREGVRRDHFAEVNLMAFLTSSARRERPPRGAWRWRRDNIRRSLARGIPQEPK